MAGYDRVPIGKGEFPKYYKQLYEQYVGKLEPGVKITAHSGRKYAIQSQLDAGLSETVVAQGHGKKQLTTNYTTSSGQQSILRSQAIKGCLKRQLPPRKTPSPAAPSSSSSSSYHHQQYQMQMPMQYPMQQYPMMQYPMMQMPMQMPMQQYPMMQMPMQYPMHPPPTPHPNREAELHAREIALHRRELELAGRLECPVVEAPSDLDSSFESTHTTTSTSTTRSPNPKRYQKEVSFATDSIPSFDWDAVDSFAADLHDLV